MNNRPPKAHSVHGSRSSLTAGAFLGAIFIHPVAFAIAWLKGLALGASVPMAPTPTSEDGIAGGFASVEQLLFIYAATIGIVPLFISLVGAVCGFFLTRRFGVFSEKLESVSTRQHAFTSPALITAIWASSLYIGQFCIVSLIFMFFVGPVSTNVSAIFIGLHLCIWGLGAAIAFMKHGDLRVVAGMIGIAILLPILGPILPRFLVLTASIAILCLCVSKRVLVSSRDS